MAHAEVSWLLKSHRPKHSVLRSAVYARQHGHDEDGSVKRAEGFRGSRAFPRLAYRDANRGERESSTAVERVRLTKPSGCCSMERECAFAIRAVLFD